MLVREAIGGFPARADLDVVGLAHEVVVVDALRALAGTYVGEDLGKAAHGIGVNERCTGCMIRASTDGDSKGGAAIMVESAAANATGGYFGNVFGHCSSWCGS
ncbi:hypothetical protein AYX22_03670 [Arthrobacter sp. D5-1]|nr:hypothetical protein AYX22_03670 [Arthrobacter sp. D5-1]